MNTPNNEKLCVEGGGRQISANEEDCRQGIQTVTCPGSDGEQPDGDD